jgi:eukaryotic-like serine/threonine-protein kinase
VSDSEADPHSSRWGFAEGDELTAGITALRLLGGGLRYEAYLAWDDRLQSLVVVKVVRPGLVEDARTLRGLEDEVALLSRLQHPVIVRSFGAQAGGSRPHVVLEHIEGPRLSTLIRKSGPLPLEQVVPLGIQLCAAAHYLAGAGVAHLDIKASNIIMAAPPRLIDLSVARTVEQCARLRSAVGTDAYMAPEQCRPDGGGVGPASDVWGIGVTLYEAVVGARPFPRGDPAADDPAARWPQLTARPSAEPLPPAVAKPIIACLAPDPSERPAPAHVLPVLEAALADLPRPWVSKLKPRVGERRRSPV